MTEPVDKPIKCPVLIGRGPHLAALRLMMEQARTGQGQVLLLCGEAGIGKSSLVDELEISATAQGFQVLEGRCYDIDLAYPYAPLRELLRSFFAFLSPPEIVTAVGPYARALSPLLPERVSLLPELASLPALLQLSPEQEKRRLFAALADFFLQQTVQRPLLLIVEDVHWSDDSSLEFLHYLIRQIATKPLLLLCTYRSDEVSPLLGHWLAQLDRERISQEVALAPLTRSETEAMLQAIFAAQGSLPRETLDMVFGLTEGNPFFIEEVLKALIVAGELVYTEGAWQRKQQGAWRIPRSVQDAVQQRSRRLSASAQQVLRLASVAGRRFDFTVLQHITHHDEQQLLTIMKELIAAQLVEEESAEQLVFRHALTRQAVYTAMLARERRALHATLAEILEMLYASAPEEHLADLAYHFAEAEVWNKALEYAQQAGAQAQALYAPRGAVEQWTRAIEAAGHLGNDAPVACYRARGLAYETLGDFERARADYEQTLQYAHEADDGPLTWQSLLDLGFLWAGRDYEQAGKWFEQAMRLAERLGDARLRAQSLNWLANWYMNTGHSAQGLQGHTAALTLFEEQQDSAGMARTLDLLGMASCIAGDIVNSVIYYGRAIELLRPLGDRKTLSSCLAMHGLMTSPNATEECFIIHRSLAECERDVKEARQLARDIGWVDGEAFAELSYAQVLNSFGQLGAALEHGQAGLHLATTINHRQWIAAAHAMIARIYLFLLAPEQALLHAEVGLILARQLGSTFWLDWNLFCQVQAYLQQGQLLLAEAALQAAQPPENQPQSWTERALLRMWAELALAQGRPELALQRCEVVLQTAIRIPGITEGQVISAVLKCKGEALAALGKLEESSEILEQARRSATIYQAPPHLWQIERALGQVYQRLRQDEQAQRAFSSARTIISGLANTIGELPLREQFVQRALASFPQNSSRSYKDKVKQVFGGLTEREREVAGLVAQGKSNREIASILVVEYRTAESHVSSILSKLGFNKRSQIAVWASEKGLDK